MKNVQCICFPRSGHHLVVNILFKYFSKDIDFMEVNGNKSRVYFDKIIKAGDFYYCECYAHCHEFPCSDKKTNLQKNHDYDLDLGIDKKYKYIIIYRDVIESLISIYNYYLNKPYDLFKGMKIIDNNDGWKVFAKKTTEYWKGFIRKWITENEMQTKDVLFINYEEIIKNPLSIFINLIKFIDPGKNVNLYFLKEIIDRLSIKKRSKVQNFKYYNKDFYSRIKEEVKEEYSIMNM
ncbi:MAG: sulfotransferase domain-containing protein [archaeon]